MLHEYTPNKEYERLTGQYEKLNAHCQSGTVPVEQYNHAMSEVSRLQELVKESVPRKEYNAIADSYQALVERQYSSFVPKEKHEALDKEFSEFKSQVGAETVPMGRYEDLKAANKRLLKRVSEEFVDRQQHERVEAQLECALEDRRLVEESARVIEDEKESALREALSKERELDGVRSKLAASLREYEVLASLVAESNAVIVNLREEVEYLQSKLSEQGKRALAVEADRAGLMIQLGNAKVKARHLAQERAITEHQFEEASEERQRLAQLQIQEASLRMLAEERASSLEGEVEQLRRQNESLGIQCDMYRATDLDDLARERAENIHDSSTVNLHVPLSPLRPLYLLTPPRSTGLKPGSCLDNDVSIRLSPIKSLDERIKEYQENERC
jgi:chromosome segregation ATPase